MRSIFALRPAGNSPLAMKRWAFLGLVTLSLLITQWLGLVHQIGHHEFKISAAQQLQASHTSCNSHGHSLFAFLGHEEHSVECQLFDAISLAGLITGSSISFVVSQPISEHFLGLTVNPSNSLAIQPYQSRAPPLITLKSSLGD